MQSALSMGRHKVKVKHSDSLLVQRNSSQVKSRGSFLVCFHQQHQKAQSLFTVSYPISKI
uniref:Uncharacterized protein n=2 Tax=Sus scrofa TaxID=9823 RepID=A0A8W4FBY2_PIG